MKRIAIPSGGNAAPAFDMPIANISRRKLMMGLDFVIITNTLILILMPHLWILVCCRIIQGICIGIISSASPLYIRELAPKQASGSLGPINQICIVTGVSFSFFFSYLLSLIFPV